jgi:nicotinamidase-related amidase
MASCLLIIDIQNDYFPGGAYPLVGPEAAGDAARTLLERFRQSSLPVVHVKHAWDEPGADFMVPGTFGAEINDRVKPVAGEPVVQKGFPNSFRETGLANVLAGLNADELVIAGMMTSMCVDATVRAAADFGFRVTVVADACAAPDLEFGGRAVAAADVQAAYLASLASDYATVTTLTEYLIQSA